MHEIARRDRQLMVQALLEPGRLIVLVVTAAFAIWVATRGGIPLPFKVMTWLVTAFITYWYAEQVKQHILAKRFTHKRYELLWSTAEDRMKRLREALDAMKKDRIADLQVLPTTIASVSESLYIALRRADQIQLEIEKSEGALAHAPHPKNLGATPSKDAHVQDLYRLADKNIAEYRQRFGALMSGMQRCEAQAAVFITTLDALRMRILGYRLTGRNPEIEHQEFLLAITEAKSQLEAVDTALAELDYQQLPPLIEDVPPPIPEDAQIRERL